jgi:hypothetical protein
VSGSRMMVVVVTMMMPRSSKSRCCKQQREGKDHSLLHGLIMAYSRGRGILEI